jgi:putative endonuclease
MRTPNRRILRATAASSTGSDLGSRLDRKRAALRIGRSAEAAVVLDLQRRGFVVLATNLRIGRLELDVVAQDGDTIAVVEVRTRGESAWQTGMASIAPLKAKRVRAAGERLWRERFQRDARVNRMRFDVAVVTFGEGGAPAIEYARAVL